MTLTTLRVRDLATIADVALELGPGLNVLTGETGAGKSMLIDAIALLLGDRADRAAIRPGATRAVIEGVFEEVPDAAREQLDAAGLDAADTLVVRREVTAEGRSRAWLNGSPTTIGMLAQVGRLLVDLHGQHQTVQLLDRDTQRALLDTYADAGPALVAVRAAWRSWTALQERRRDLAARQEEVRRRADWLRHVTQEIDAARLRPGEDVELDRDAHRLGHITVLAEQAQQLGDALEDDERGARAALRRAERALGAIERADPAVADWRDLTDAIYAALDELAGRVAEYAAGLSDDPGRLAEVERRRSLLDDLKRKHGPGLDDVIATGRNAAAELELLDTADVDLRALTNQQQAAHEELVRIAARLSARRAEAAARLAREVNRQLAGLGLRGGELSVTMTPLDEPGPDGAERIEFEVRLNRGIDPRPLAGTASGGELSRLMLALKVALARHDAVPTLVFDELDQGIGGEVGTRVGAALVRVAERHQVLVITHLPQIAARADRHLRAAKATRGGMATSDVDTLHGEDRVLELARMLGDPDSDAARRLAQALLAGATA